MKKSTKKITKKETLKEILKELSVIPAFLVFMAIVALIAYLLPNSIVENLPFEAFCAIGIVAILVFLYVIAGVFAIIQKVRAKKVCAAKEKDESSD